VRIAAPTTTNGVNADEVAEALTAGAKAKKKAYRRSDSTNSVGGGRSRGHTKELALLPDDSLMCPPSFLTGLKPTLEIKDGNRLELSVSVKGDPDPQVTWTKDGKAISSSEIMEVKYKNGKATVLINEVFPEDAGRYTCRATNTKGSVETSSKVVVLPMEKRVTNGAAASSNGLGSSKHPKVMDHVKSQIMEDGDKVVFTANIGGTDKFDVVWLHNEKEIKPSKDFEYKCSGTQYSLIITEVFPEDRGTYTCEAFNESGECYSSASLEVNVPGEQTFNPVFKKFPHSLTVDKGGSASFEAELDSAPASIAWMKDGKEMKEQTMKYRMRSQGGKLGLDILECGQADAGQYALIVTNNKGEAKAAFSLNVF
jgi:hypothetical protein